MLLGTLAHNVVVWAHGWLTAPQVAAQTSLASETPATPTQTGAPLQRYGILRMVRDVFHVSGFLCLVLLARSLRLSSIKMRTWLV